MSSILNKGVQPISKNDLQRSVQLIVHALSDVLSIDSRVVEKLRAIATIQPEISSPPRKRVQKRRAQNEPKNMDPCEYCRQRKLKCEIRLGNSDVCVRCQSFGLMLCPPREARSRKRGIKEDAVAQFSKGENRSIDGKRKAHWQDFYL